MNRRQSIQSSMPKGLGLARQASKKMFTSTSTPNLEKMATVEKKGKSVEHHNRYAILPSQLDLALLTISDS